MTLDPKSSPGAAQRPARAALAGLAVALLGLASVPAPAGQQAVPAKRPPQAQTPEQKEMAKIREEIRGLEKRLQELRGSVLAARFPRDIEAKKKDDDLIAKLSDGAVAFAKVAYASKLDGFRVPAYLFQPLQPRGPQGHPALVWVHGGVHSSFSSDSMPFVRMAVERGYVVIAPDYRGSTGYGRDFYAAIDYGGAEIDDVLTALDYLKAEVPIADPDRLGMIGWSHGGFITLHSLIRDQGAVLKCGYAGVPVTNLVFRLSYKGPEYAADFIAEPGIGGPVHEKRDVYIARSPLYHVDKIKVPVMVHVATNDQDVNFVEDQMMVQALEYHIPRLAETKIYVDPPGGHSFDRLVNKDKTAPQNTIPQRDSWNRIWTFLETNLKPYLGAGGKPVEGR